jgi:hypothetical protein
MKLNYLLPNKFRRIGFIGLLIIISLIITLQFLPNYSPIHQLWLKAIFKILIFVAIYFIIYSKEKIEDEFVTNCRLKALSSCLIYLFIYSIMNDFNVFISIKTQSPFSIACIISSIYYGTFKGMLKGQVQ